jgi:hypothetical protein
MNPLRRLCVVSGIILGIFHSASAQSAQPHVGRVSDWSSRHLAVSGGPSAANLKAAATEPRILFYLADRNLVRFQNGALKFFANAPSPAKELIDGQTPSENGLPSIKNGSVHRDWSVSLGTGNVSQSKFPAKYSFNINGTPSCTADYAVFALNVAGTKNGQANIVGIDELYSGTGPTG